MTAFYIPLNSYYFKYNKSRVVSLFKFKWLWRGLFWIFLEIKYLFIIPLVSSATFMIVISSQCRRKLSLNFEFPWEFSKPIIFLPHHWSDSSQSLNSGFWGIPLMQCFWSMLMLLHIQFYSSRDSASGDSDDAEVAVDEPEYVSEEAEVAVDDASD